MYEEFEINKVLVIAPKRVAEDTWSRESQKWDHLQHLRIAKVLGTASQRTNALNREADIYVTNRENVKWLVDLCRQRRQWPFDMMVIDELSSFKSNRSQRFKNLKSVLPLVKRVVGLTGTPSPNSLMDLWPQIYLLDRGQRLGKTITGFRDRYFLPGIRNGYTVFTWDLKEGADKSIQDKIKDICISMSAEDYLSLPEKITNIVPVKLSDKEQAKYKELEKNQIMEMDGEQIVALTAGVVAGKLLQLANGAVYDEKKEYRVLHERKLDALEEILDTNPEPVLVFYNFKHDYEQLVNRFGKLKPRTLETSKDIEEWNKGNIRLLLAHPASVGHGLNIQEGGNVIVWYGLPWSLELYQQANARLYRQGQKRNVIIHHLVAEGTIDENVMKVLGRKDSGQRSLLDALKEREELYV